MLKKLLSLLLCLCLLPSFALAADFDPTAYSDEELEAILRLIVAHLYSEKEDAEDQAFILYEDENIALHYSSFDEIGDEENLYLSLLLLNKIEYEITLELVSLGINNFFIESPDRPSVEMQSEIVITVPIPRTELAKYPIEAFQSLSLGFSYWSKGLSLPLISCSTPTIAIPNSSSLANLSLARYSRAELESMNKTQLQLLLDYLDPTGTFLYEDENVAMYYLKFDEQGDDENVYVYLIISNKNEKLFACSFETVFINYLPFNVRKYANVTPYSNTIAQIPINRGELGENFTKSLKSISFKCKYFEVDVPKDDPIYEIATLTLPINH